MLYFNSLFEQTTDQFTKITHCSYIEFFAIDRGTSMDIAMLYQENQKTAKNDH